MAATIARLIAKTKMRMIPKTAAPVTRVSVARASQAELAVSNTQVSEHVVCGARAPTLSHPHSLPAPRAASFIVFSRIALNAEPLTSIVTAMLVPSPLHRNERKPPDLDVHASGREGRLGDGWIEFRSARWLVATVALLWLWLVRPRFGKRALVTLAWRFTPRRFKLIAGGVAALGLIVLAGSIAALFLVLDQLA